MLIAADILGHRGAAVRQEDFELPLGAVNVVFDDVVIGDDVAVAAVDDPRTFTRLFNELAAEPAQAGPDQGGNPDSYHRGASFLGDFWNIHQDRTGQV